MPVYRRKNLIGVVEAKDLHVDLAEIAANAAAGRTDHNAEQFRAYLAEYDNLLYTNYVEWRLYRRHDATPARVAVLAHVGADGKVHTTKEGREAFENVVGVFLAARPESHATAKGLAGDMARLTKVLDADTRQALGENDPFLKDLHGVFQEELIHGLSADEFADMYAQTIAYGLFSARILHAGESRPGEFNRYAAERALPATNPFLRRVFGSLVNDLDMPKQVVGTVEELAALIGAADMAAIAEELARFGKRRGRGDDVAEHDPIIYFYERFLRAYDPEKARKRGVYYTPLPVVRYIVNSIDELLKREFDLADGLADPSVIILDPACGTGTFLYEVVRLINERIGTRGAAAWNEYVPGLLGRLFGFELLMAPYTIAHLKLAGLLRETGYEFREGQRLGVYLTNTLEEAEQHVEQKMLPGIMGAISREKEGADRVKAEAPVMVVLGNPPYAGHSANKGRWIGRLLKEGYELPGGGRRPGYYEVDGEPLKERASKWLQDDYAKFLRWAQWRIDQTGRGVVGMITNHGYLDGLTFRGARQNLMATFDALYLYDLHGSTRKKERAPGGGKDENVFAIEQGVAVALMAKGARVKGVSRAELYGLRRDKYAALDAGDVTTTEWTPIEPGPPFYVFEPRDSEAEDEYNQGVRLPDLVPAKVVGIVTARDRLTIDFDAEVLWRQVIDFASLGEEEARAKYRLGKDVIEWKVRLAQEDVRASGPSRDNVKPILYRPFDVRAIYYTGVSRGFICRPRPEVMSHMLAGENLGLITPRNLEIEQPWRNALVTDTIIEHVPVSYKTIDYVFPFYQYTNAGELEGEKPGRAPNITKAVASDFLSAVGARALENSPEVGQRSDSREVLYAEDIFYYIYGVLHSPTYRARYAEFLKLDFPRIPFPKDYESFDRLAGAGQRLADLHLLKDKDRWGWRGIEQRGEAKEAVVGKVEYDDSSEEVIFDARRPRPEQYRLGPVPRHVWELHIGGYQVLRKWLKDRKGRKVAPGDYVAIIIALAETDRIMREECDPAFKEMMGLY
jgi:hypothetical protein